MIGSSTLGAIPGVSLMSGTIAGVEAILFTVPVA